MISRWCIGVGLVLVDQFWKWKQGQVVCNEGVAFGIMLPYTTFLSIGALFLVAGAWKWVHFEKTALSRLGFVSVVGGAVSNIFDRVMHGCVMDVMQPVMWFPAFNIADVAIMAGAIMIGWGEWIVREEPLKKRLLYVDFSRDG